MAEITAALVKDLREKTGAGMMDCKRALAETGGDLEGAVDWLRKKGLSAAAKKAGRVAAEGLVAVTASGGRGAAVEVNAETDFVARNETFQKFAATLGQIALEKGGDLEKARALLDAGADLTARDEHLRSTPLAWAAKFGRTEMVRLLLERGAPRSLPDDPAWATPLAWAKKRGHDDVVRLLEEASTPGASGRSPDLHRPQSDTPRRQR